MRKNRYNEAWNKPYKEAFAFMDACLSSGLTLAEGHKLLDKAYAVLNDVPLLDVPKQKKVAAKPVAKEQRKRSLELLKLKENAILDKIETTLENVVEELSGTKYATLANGILRAIDNYGEVPYEQVDLLAKKLSRDGYNDYAEELRTASN